ncbi:MAG TPA: Gfo/Idh/MocA family oxidoreductase [Planctomycetaceae bacterium]|nr:Gfo/Idh/MocA family oxidoreductase [Planctomycetaceae bacterium]
MSRSTTRRDFLKTTAAAAATTPFWFSLESARANRFQSPNERPVLGCIGTGDRWQGVGPDAMRYADCVAVCDVDAAHAGRGRDRARDIQSRKGQARDVAVFEDYRKLLERDDVDVVTIVTPDHWHSKIAIEAMQAGKDVYCEKPLTLTILEGKQIRKVLDETKRVFQVGTQQRTEMDQRFLIAIAMIRDGRIGEVKRCLCDIGGAPTSDAIPKADPPSHLNWEMWLGQAPLVDYRFKDTGSRYGNSRCHYEFRWWYEYSGGKLTDWGAHHVDIAQWAIEQNGEGQGPAKITPVVAEHPVEFNNGHPVQDDRYNTSHKFSLHAEFPNGVLMEIVSDSPDGNGILFEGTAGRFHVGRGRMKGKPFEDLASNPLPDGAIEQVYGGKKPTSHMQNFFDCVMSRELPISDVYTHHRALTTCHLANIALRLGRELTWDAKAEQIVGDDEANHWQGREQRKGYEINVSV